MRHRLFLTILLHISLACVAPSVLAADPSMRELEQKLEARDKVILELLERVEQLEQRVGVRRVEPSPPDSEEENRAPEGRPDQPRGLVVVKEGEEERALERALTREGALLLSKGEMEVESRLSYARKEDKAPVLISSDDGTFAGETRSNANNLTANLGVRVGMIWDSQLEIDLPYHYRQIEFVSSVKSLPIDASDVSGSGLGDLRVGLAKTLFRGWGNGGDLVFRFRWDTHTGETEDQGLDIAGGYDELEGSLTAIKRQDPVVFVGTLAYEHVLERDDIQPGSKVSGLFGSQIALSPETSLSLQLATAYQHETEFHGKEVDGSARTLATFFLGGSTLLARGTLLGFSGGIGLTDQANDFSVSLSLTKRFNRPLF